MIDFKDYSDFILGIIKKNNFEDVVISAYAYGSLAHGNFEKNYSNADLFFVMKCNSIQERITLVKQLSKVFNEELKKYLDMVNGIKKNKKSKYNIINWYFTEEEFKKYYISYPTRVIYPFKKNVWKLAYGKDYFSDVELPSRETCMKYLQYDFEMFSHEFQLYAFTTNTRDMVKYFLRVLKKAIWILEDTYLSCKDEVLEKADIILSNDKFLVDIIEKIRDLKKKDYVLVGNEYLEFYLDLCRVIELYGLKIKDYVITNKYALIDKDKFYSTTTWGNFAREFAVSLKNYASIGNRNKKKLMNLLHEGYSQFMKCFNYIAINNLKAEEVMFGKGYTPPRSKILNALFIDKNIYNELSQIDGFKFLIGDHMENIVKNKFNKMKIEEIIEYIEHRYFPAIYDVFYYFLKR